MRATCKLFAGTATACWQGHEQHVHERAVASCRLHCEPHNPTSSQVSLVFCAYRGVPGQLWSDDFGLWLIEFLCERDKTVRCGPAVGIFGLCGQVQTSESLRGQGSSYALIHKHLSTHLSSRRPADPLCSGQEKFASKQISPIDLMTDNDQTIAAFC